MSVGDRISEGGGWVFVRLLPPNLLVPRYKFGQKLTSMFRSNSYEKKSFSVQFFFEIEIVVCICVCAEKFIQMCIKLANKMNNQQKMKKKIVFNFFSQYD